ncbi:MAG TPA: DUF2092 domain-containing protein [Pseudomonadales bacterium]|nr:DUF2092 domain-containing protein [Pseudomonadales bacterium]
MKPVSSIIYSLTLAMLLGTTSTQAGIETQTTPDAKAILQKMAQQLAQAPGFSVTINSEYDAMQTSGLNVTFGSRHQVSLQRPAQLRIDATRSDGDQDMLLFDGKTLTAFKADDNVYAQIEKPGTVDDVVVYMVKDLQMTVPLARLLLTTLPQELEKKAESVTYVEQDVLTDIPTDHIIVRSADVDFQVWITQGQPSLLRKIVITYKHLDGQPQFRAVLSDWNFTPAFKPALFTWTPPADVEKIPLLAPAYTNLPVTAEQGVTP